MLVTRKVSSIDLVLQGETNRITPLQIIQKPAEAGCVPQGRLEYHPPMGTTVLSERTEQNVQSRVPPGRFEYHPLNGDFNFN